MTGCNVYGWCEVDHSKDQDEIDANYHKMTVESSVHEYTLSVLGGKPRLWLNPSYEWTIEEGDEGEIDHAVAMLIEMKNAWARFLVDIQTHRAEDEARWPQVVKSIRGSDA